MSQSDPASANVRHQRALANIKLLHTAIWAGFVVCIAAIPCAAWAHRFRLTSLLSALVWCECVVLAVNRGRCPLTNMAAKHTSDRKPDFDIFLPQWIARWNKQIFGALFVIGEIYALVVWRGIR